MKLIDRATKIEECRRIIKAFNIEVSKGKQGETNLNDVIDVIRELYSDGYSIETIANALNVTLAEVLLCVGIKRPKGLTSEEFFGVSSVYEESENPELALIAEETTVGYEGYSNFYIYEHKVTKENYVIIEVYNEIEHNLVDLDMILYSKSSDNSNKANAMCNPLVINKVANRVGVTNLYLELKPIINVMLKYTGIDIKG